MSAAVLALRLHQRPVVITDPPAPLGALFPELRDRLDPNTATIPELAVLPGIGPSKAEAIVAYRTAQPAPAFRQPMDLTQVRGIGEVTAMKLAPYLYFPDPEGSGEAGAGTPGAKPQ